MKKRYRSSSRTRKPSLSPRTSFKKQDSLLMSTQDAALPATISPSPELAQPGQVDDPSSQAAATGVTTDSGIRQRKRQAPSLEEYLAARKREDQADGETGLLPIKRPTTASGSQAGSGLGARDKLFDGVRPGMGSAQMHEELGGQLADVCAPLARLSQADADGPRCLGSSSSTRCTSRMRSSRRKPCWTRRPAS